MLMFFIKYSIIPVIRYDNMASYSDMSVPQLRKLCNKRKLLKVSGGTYVKKDELVKALVGVNGGKKTTNPDDHEIEMYKFVFDYTNKLHFTKRDFLKMRMDKKIELYTFDRNFEESGFIWHTDEDLCKHKNQKRQISKKNSKKVQKNKLTDKKYYNPFPDGDPNGGRKKGNSYRPSFFFEYTTHKFWRSQKNKDTPWLWSFSDYNHPPDSEGYCHPVHGFFESPSGEKYWYPINCKEVWDKYPLNGKIGWRGPLILKSKLDRLEKQRKLPNVYWTSISDFENKLIRIHSRQYDKIIWNSQSPAIKMSSQCKGAFNKRTFKKSSAKSKTKTKKKK